MHLCNYLDLIIHCMGAVVGMGAVVDAHMCAVFVLLSNAFLLLVPHALGCSQDTRGVVLHTQGTWCTQCFSALHIAPAATGFLAIAEWFHYRNCASQ